MILTPLGELAGACLEQIPDHSSGVSVDTYCVMPDHIHAIIILGSVGPPYMAADRSKQTLSKVIQQYKAAVSRQTHLSDLWQSGYYDHVIRNQQDLAETRRYIRDNPCASLERRPL